MSRVAYKPTLVKASKMQPMTTSMMIIAFDIRFSPSRPASPISAEKL